jgi:hypothetical protein
VKEAEGRLGGQRERLEATRARLAAAVTEGARLSADLEQRIKEKVRNVVSLLSIGYSDLEDTRAHSSSSEKEPVLAQFSTLSKQMCKINY